MGGELNLARETVMQEAILHISHGTGSPKRSYPPNSRTFIRISMLFYGQLPPLGPGLERVSTCQSKSTHQCARARWQA